MGNDILQAIPELEEDIPADLFIKEGFWTPLTCVYAGVLLLAIGLAWWLYRRYKRKTTVRIAPLQKALQALAELDSQLPPMRECALRLSMILRSYLAGQTQDSSLYETHEEFSQRMDSLANVPISCQQETYELLDFLASYKYAGDTTIDESLAHTLVERAKELVITIEKEQLEELNFKKEGAI
jgi:hypothetical protein